MPLTRITHAPGLDGGAAAEAVQRALVATFDTPADDSFQIVTEANPDEGLRRPPAYRGVTYSDQLMVVEITCNDTRTVEQKKALYAAIADNLHADLRLRREDVVIVLTEVRKENWSFGGGLATYA